MFEFILEILKYIGFPSLLLFFVQRHYSKKDKLLEKEQKQNKKTEDQIEKMNDNFEEYREKFEKITEAVSDIQENQKKLTQITEITMRSSADLLRDKMLNMYKKYYEDEKYLPLHIKENFVHMYHDYKELGGNGMIDDIYVKVMSLPSKK